MQPFQLLPARAEHIDEYLKVLDSAREFQRSQGFIQWPDGYPGRQEVEDDLRLKTGYALMAGDTVAGYLYLGFDGDSAYPKIKGAWRYDAPYAVIHRMAIGADFRGQGLSDTAFRLAEDICKSRGFRVLRIDTDEANKRMQHILRKNGFVCCGTVVQGGGDRLAFEKQLSD